MVFLKLLWFSFIGFLPLWAAVIGGIYLLIKEQIEKRMGNDYGE